MTSLARPASSKQWRVLRTAARSHAMRFMAREEAKPKNCLLLQSTGGASVCLLL